MLRTLVTRLVSSVAVFLLIAVGLFALVRLAPGDPIEMMVPPEIGGADREAYTAAVRERFGLDQPVVVQFWRWLGGLMTGDLGYSYTNGQPVGELLADRLGPTALLMGSALLIGLIIAVPAGVIAAVRQNSIADYTISSVSVIAISVPSFFLGMLAIYFFAVKLQVLPSSGMHGTGRDDLGDLLLHMVMPVGLLALANAASFIRYVRSGVLEELGKDYVRTIIAKGGTPSRALRHALRNSLLSLVTVLAMTIPITLSGAVVLEQIFAWPGMGQLAIYALTNRDYPILIGFGLYIALLVLVCNLIADLSYSIIDPRVRTAR
ncbi:peptide/nickel transport system permease protein [Agrococcus baldri]|jgi:peptide/nickel transport system permease protein|uniref:Peptide/nickel transport system permease protein n=1 Tax=Agrococcus baldri TaxID=153730 RepID=A0AA94HLB4_9MICO|nr:ABC transporter permease [Agrococcus baldri]SFS06875.1 peptide/nickel transport system permease protein [Agrococcus baldri]